MPRKIVVRNPWINSSEVFNHVISFKVQPGVANVIACSSAAVDGGEVGTFDFRNRTGDTLRDVTYILAEKLEQGASLEGLLAHLEGYNPIPGDGGTDEKQ